MIARMIPVMIVLLFTLTLSSCAGNTSPIRGNGGGVKPGSIALMEKVLLGGYPQAVIIRGHDTNNPVLVFVHGGPGMPEGGMLRKFCPELERHFTVVDWEQRGAGLSFSPDLPLSTLTLSNLSADLEELCRYAASKFGRKKVYLLAHSAGTAVAIDRISRSPELFEAYVGLGQVSDQKRSELLSYEYCLAEARKRTNTEAQRELGLVAWPSNGYYTNAAFPDIYESMNYPRKWLGTFGGVVRDSGKMMDYMLPAVFCEEHSLPQALDMASFKAFGISMARIWPQIIERNFMETDREFLVPVYFLEGRHDYDASSALAEEYFNKISAPKKGLVWFENSAHMPMVEEKNIFLDFMTNRLLGRGDR